MYRRREREREEGSRYNVNERWKAERSGEISLSISLAGEAPARMRHRVGNLGLKLEERVSQHFLSGFLATMVSSINIACCGKNFQKQSHEIMKQR